MVFIAMSQVWFIELRDGGGRLLWAGFGFESPRNPWLLAWLGFFASSTFAMGYALFLPVGGIPFTVFVLCGLAGLILIGLDRWKASSLSSYWSRGLLVALFLVLFALDYTTTIRVWSMLEGDTGLYHATLVRWLNEYGTVLGLANLHVRFGNVSSWFYFAALIEQGPWDGYGAALLPGMGLICGLMYILHELLFGKNNFVKVYSIVFCFYILILISRYNRPTFYYDFPSLILNGIVVLEALKVMLRKEHRPMSGLCIPAFLVASAFTIKTIPVISVLMVSGMVLWLLWRNSQATLKNLFQVFGLPLLTAAVWMSSNAMLSGYPLFPLAVMALPVDWLIAPDQVQAAYDAVKGWGRLPGNDYLLALSSGTWFWLKPWLMRVPVSFPGLLTLPFVLGLSGWAYLLWRREYDRVALFFLVWTTLGITYWFIMAPDVRFGSGLMWSFAGCAAAFVIPEGKVPQAVWLQRGLAFALVITALALVVRTPVWKDTGPQWLSIPPLPSGSVVPYEVHNGSDSFTVWTRQEGSDCMNAPLPCTPTPSQEIRLRDPLDMGAGFAPLNPYARHSR